MDIFFDLIGLAFANNYIVYDMMHSNDLTLFDFKTIVSTYFIGRYINRSLAPPDDKADSKRKYQYHFEVTYHHTSEHPFVDIVK